MSLAEPEAKWSETVIYMPALSTFFTDVWDTVFSLVNSNVADPESRGKKWVYSSFPMARIDDSTAYPLIVINPPDPTSNKLTLGSSHLTDFPVPATIEIFALKSSQIDSISSDIMNIIFTNESSLQSSGLHNPELTGSDTPAAAERSGKTVHMKSLTFTFQSTLTVG